MGHLRTALAGACFAFCILCAGCGDHSTAVIPNFRDFVTQEVVFFSSDRQGPNKNIFMMSTDGKILKQITHFSDGDYVPTAISADGTRLLFYQARPGFDIEVGLYTYLCFITSDSIVGPITVGQPGNFSPDGQTFVFSRHTFTSDGGYDSIYLHDLTNGMEVKLTQDGKTSFYPQFSPDGNTIVFQSAKFPFRDSISCWQIHLLDVRSRAIIDLTKYQWGTYASNPVFAADGASVFFYYNEQTWCYDICRMPLATRTLQYITRNRYDGRFDITKSFHNPSVSALDGSVYFYSWPVDGRYPHPVNIYSCKADGSGLKNISNDSHWNSHPVVGTASFYLTPWDPH